MLTSRITEGESLNFMVTIMEIRNFTFCFGYCIWIVSARWTSKKVIWWCWLCF